jgi:hypothetical protein
MKPGTFNKDSQVPVTVNSEETRTTDTNEKVFQKGESCFYKSEHGPFEQGIIESVDNSDNPTSYGVRILPRMKETTAKNLYRELPQYYSQGVLQEDPVHETQSDDIVAGNNGPWSQSNKQLNNQSQELFSMLQKSGVYRDAVRFEGAGHSRGASKLTVKGKRRGQSITRNSLSSERTLKQGQNNTDVDEPVYPEADYGCMSLKSLYQ